MNGNSSQDRDELLVTGIPPAAEPVPGPLTDPSADPATETKPLTAAAPVFVDASGWRTRLGRRLGLLTGALLIVFLGALALGMTTGTDVPLTPWSEPSPHPRVQVSHPPEAKPTVTDRPEPPAAVRPTPTRRVAAPAPPATPKPSSTPATTPARAASTSHPGKSTAEPPAWGRNKKKP
ncbi:hypothetical protein HUT06_00720 [Actinomadura sp. NAK00032]|uniref:hypothetical protein n=1 Tax=Actinomadura sp. NAK00032 TaxID=2742128 RepID=UPI0015918A14|nr:hypothetical protein [Actinomadura sp. NAK00032]QKW32735.1 hypothetical protein HUT06_00720 [Actinomadura sp. NAK00032]